MIKISSKSASVDLKSIQKLFGKNLSIIFDRFTQGLTRLNNNKNQKKLLPDSSFSKLINYLDISEFKSQNICIIGHSALLKTTICRLFIDHALLNQQTVYVVSGDYQDYDTYQDKVSLQRYRSPIMMAGSDYDLYFDNCVCDLLKDIEPIKNALIVVDEIDPWRKRSDILKNLVNKAKAVNAQVICVSQNYQPREEFLKCFSVFLVPVDLSKKRSRWFHEFLMIMDQISKPDKEVQPFEYPSQIFQIRYLNPN